MEGVTLRAAPVVFYTAPSLPLDRFQIIEKIGKIGFQHLPIRAAIGVNMAQPNGGKVGHRGGRIVFCKLAHDKAADKFAWEIPVIALFQPSQVRRHDIKLQ